ncbi:Hypothetical predicted protein [Lecanosticta acicola]|uniref:SDR family NAD(P)-dependent oxidoreductase n=1 Tax=Lecanosticta acicola TaxID=111012 RepID=A0AAI8YUJ3_9PEZI|nr:Hypothetical predicted protein [Lecanosticta acicola]
MARILITGSSDGIGQAAARHLTAQGHRVTLHARNPSRATQAQAQLPGAEAILIGDLSNLEETRRLARKANAHGPWDAVVHNAGIAETAGGKRTADGMALTFQVNTLAPYVLTSLMARPKRLLFLSSALHAGGDASLRDVAWREREGAFEAFQAYGDTKLQDIMLANAVARYWPDVQSCALDPGWIQTKMGGGGAPGTTATPARAIADFAVGESGITGDRTGVYFTPGGARTPHAAAADEGRQEALLEVCERLSGVAFPR